MEFESPTAKGGNMKIQYLGTSATERIPAKGRRYNNQGLLERRVLTKVTPLENKVPTTPQTIPVAI